MKICIDCRMWGRPYAGIGRYTKEIVEHILLHKRWSLALLCFEPSYKELEDFIHRNSITDVELILCKNGLFSLKAQIELFFKIPKCDVLWIPSINIPLLPTRAKTMISTIHDVFHIAHPEYYSWLKLSVLKLLIGSCVKKSKLIFTVSDFSASEILRFFGEENRKKIVRIYNGFTPIRKDNITNCDRYKNFFLFVGSVKPHKNLKNALLGFEEFSRVSNDVSLVIVGKKDGFVTADNEFDSIVSRINQNKEKVFFVGNVNDDELYSLYNGARALIFPSFYEGFGLPLIEAMYFGLPIACSDIGVFYEICGDNVQYFDPYSIKSITDAISKVYKENRKEYPRWQSWDITGDMVSSNIEKLVLR